VDLSKHRATDETFALLLDLARASGVTAARRAMFAGERINTSENRPVLHVALRDPHGEPLVVDGADVRAHVRTVLGQMRAFTEVVRSGVWRGFTGEPITDVVNIGIGGSHLGPQMAVRALRPYAKAGPKVHFVANVDGAALADTLAGLDPARTLFLVASKTFTTQETMRNALSARDWLVRALGGEEAVAGHFAALSTNGRAVRAFGIDTANMFEFWDWVGGRYSLWSAIGLSIALAVGFEAFEELLAGARELDRHFQSAPLERNVPVLMALLGVWYGGFFGAQSLAVLPYDESLEFLPAFLQQLDMESNGKSVTRGGLPVDQQTGPVVFGQSGTNGQHAFYQLLHQGTVLVPADFIAPVEPQHDLGGHHAILLANFLAQTQALMRGRDHAETRASLRATGQARGTASAGAAGGEAPSAELLTAAKSFPGDRPTTSILMPKLTPKTLGMLIALYEHKVFVQGVVWDVNSFDQMGVELGKELAGPLLAELGANGSAGEPNALDASTSGLLRYIRASRST